MKTVYEVLSREEVERIHAASMEVLQTVGIKVDYPFARDLFRKAGAQVDDQQQSVRIPETLVPGRSTRLPNISNFTARTANWRWRSAAMLFSLLR